jgi:hypothetical protein
VRFQEELDSVLLLCSKQVPIYGRFNPFLSRTGVHHGEIKNLLQELKLSNLFIGVEKVFGCYENHVRIEKSRGY